MRGEVYPCPTGCGRPLMSKVKLIAQNSFKVMKTLIPLFFLANIASVFLEYFIPEGLVYSILGENVWVSIPLATLLGVLAPLPRYATYPLASTLFRMGASIGAVSSLIWGEVILGSLDRDVIEFKYFGWRSFVARLLLSIGFTILGGFAVEVLL
jgi:uncharacterized membrane protein YraQ (UPF0718 family)